MAVVKMARAAAVLVGLGFIAAMPAAAQSGIGIQGSYADDLRAGFGARAAFLLGPTLGQEPGTALAALHGLISADHYPEPGYTELNANAFLPVLRLGRTGVYVGGGVHTGWNGEGSATGLNALGGATLRVPFTTVFGEARYRFGADDMVFTLGFLFGRG